MKYFVRECIHPKIPQLAIIGFSESVANLYTSGIKCRWLAELLDGKFKLPSTKIMEKDIAEWDEYKKRYSITGDHASVHYIFGTMINFARTWAGILRGKRVFGLSGSNLTDQWITQAQYKISTEVFHPSSKD